MNEFKKWHNQTVARDIVEVLNKKKYVATYAENFEEARKLVLDMIPEGVSIGIGGSITLTEMGLIDTFREGNYRLIDRYEPGITWQEVGNRYKEALHADYFVTGTNAITRNGELVNVDSSGNRVAAMIYGPSKVVIVAGVNKVVDDLEEAMKRLKKIAPLNCKRLNHQTPCRETGYCCDCSTQHRMCNFTGIIHHGMKIEDRINIIVVAEEAGF